MRQCKTFTSVKPSVRRMTTMTNARENRTASASTANAAMAPSPKWLCTSSRFQVKCAVSGSASASLPPTRISINRTSAALSKRPSAETSPPGAHQRHLPLAVPQQRPLAAVVPMSRLLVLPQLPPAPVPLSPLPWLANSALLSSLEVLLLFSALPYRRLDVMSYTGYTGYKQWTGSMAA